jgi:hypothetical protein
MTAETLDTLRRDMTAAAASLTDEKARSAAAYSELLIAALRVANAIADGRQASSFDISEFRTGREFLAVKLDREELARAKFRAIAAKFHERARSESAFVLADERALQEGR